jgi:uncharacterized HAD superfamily protein
VNKLNIGIDIDGCLNYYGKDFYNFILKTYNIEIDLTKYDNSKFLSKELGLKNINKLYNECSVNNCKPEFLSSFVVNRLNKIHNVYIITARSYERANDTINWLDKYNFNYKDILFNSGNKFEVCKYKDIDYMIDDSPFNIYNLIKNNINTIVFNRPYNQKFYNGPLIYKANNWMDIYRYLKRD